MTDLRSALIASNEQKDARTLTAVLIDVRLAQIYFNQSWGTEAESICLDRLQALQDEARAMIEHATGVSWAMIESANL